MDQRRISALIPCALRFETLIAAMLISIFCLGPCFSSFHLHTISFWFGWIMKVLVGMYRWRVVSFLSKRHCHIALMLFHFTASFALGWSSARDHISDIFFRGLSRHFSFSCRVRRQSNKSWIPSSPTIFQTHLFLFDVPLI